MKKLLITTSASLLLSSLALAQVAVTAISAGDNLKVTAIKANENSAVECVIFAKNLKYGDSARNNRYQEVKDLQDKLIEKGHLKQDLNTGYFGPATLKAVKEYQKENNISNTGYVGPLTLGQLKKHFCHQKDDKEDIKDRPVTDSCKVFFDGCNTCIKSSTSSPAGCTRMYCLTQKIKPYCKEYFDETSTTTKSEVEDVKIKACPTEKIIDKMPIVCIKAPCNPIEKSYYIYDGKKYNTEKFDSD
ncbi:MAG: hypothetical protein QG614_246, partial [Patescibacteria group bacterium]|nr:hypothetical protein [Patescibacteria group bacterium]